MATTPLTILLEGRPGSGKTTVVVRLVELLRERKAPLRGFLTHELREAGQRVGFEVETVAGRRATLAHVEFEGPPRVGKYGVDLEAFERVALPALARPPAGAVVVIDELGKMELASQPFRDAVSDLFAERVAIVATVHVARHPFTDALKRRERVELLKVTRPNRDELPRRVVELLAR